MQNDKNNKLYKIHNKNKNIIIGFCFGILLLFDLSAVPVILRRMVGNMKSSTDYIKLYSPVWYEQSKEAKVFFEQQSINLFMACAIMASLLYNKHKSLAFLCLVIPVVYIILQRIL